MGSVDIQSVERVAAILALFGPHRPEVTASEASELIGLNRTTTYRYLASLAAAQVLEMTAERGYRPGPTLVQLGAFALGRRDVVQLARGPMAALAEDTSITAVLSLWGRSAPVVAHVEEPPGREIVVTVKTGMQLSTLAAQSKVFFAFKRPEARSGSPLNVLSESERSAMSVEIERTRVQGYASQVSARGIAVLAVPINDADQMVASLALLSTGQVLDAKSRDGHLARLRETASAISAGMGAEISV